MRKIVALIVFVLLLCPGILQAAEKKVTLTTYYPAPYGEYSELEATDTLKVPVVASGTKTLSNTEAGEIWVEQ